MSDRRLWLAEPCPTCHARVGLRCQTSRYGGKPSRVLHGARGWRHRSCPSCKAQPGELCRTPTGRQAAGPHTARLSYGRRELFADEDVWQELERWGASAALVRFSGGGGHAGSIAAVTLEDAGKKELARWGHGEGELPEALAAPIWGRYALFRGHPRITGLLMWDAQERQVVVAGERGGQKFDEVLSAPRPSTWPTVMPAPPTTARDTSPGPGRPGGPTGIAARPRRRRGLARVRALRRATRRRPAPRGAVLLQALPAGRLARAAQAPAFQASLPAAREVQLVRRADARRTASGGPVLLKALPAGVLAPRPPRPPPLH